MNSVSNRKSAMFFALRFLVGIAILAYLAQGGAIRWGLIGNLAGAWPITLAVLVLLWTVPLLCSWRLCLLLNPRGFQLSLGSSMRLTLVGYFFSAFLPGSSGGDLVRILYATAENPKRRIEVTTILLMDRLVGVSTLLLLPVLLCPLFAWLLMEDATIRVLFWLAFAAEALIFTLFLVSLRGGPGGLRTLAWITRHVPQGRHLARIYQTIHAYQKMPAVLFRALGISLLAQATLLATMLLLVHAFQPVGVRPVMVLLIPLGFVANAIPATPGGIGVGEAAFDALFTVAGLSHGAMAILTWRLLTTFVDFSGLFVYLRGGKIFHPAHEPQ